MKVSEANGKNIQAGQVNMLQGTDALSKSLQKQIANAQKDLQKLSANEDMGIEEKIQKRKELQQKVHELTEQLRQRQADLRRERQQDEMPSGLGTPGGEQQKEETPDSGMSETGMKAMVSAGAAMAQAEAYGNVSTHLKGEAISLQSEIKLDKQRGQDVGKKEGKLGKIEKKIQKATSSQLGTLEGANQKLQEAGKKDREEKAGRVKEKAGSRKNKDKKTFDACI